MTRRTFTYAPAPHGTHWIIESPDGGGTVLARKPRGPSMLDPVPPRLFATEAAALLFMDSKGMQRAARITRWDTVAHRDAELDLLSAVSVAMQNATAEAPPAQERRETSDGFAARMTAYVKRAGMLDVVTPHGRMRVLRSRSRLERFARDVQRCGGFRPGKPHAIGRDREDWQAFRPATEQEARRFGAYSSEALTALLAERKAYALKIMRQRWQGMDCSAPVRLNLAWDIEVVQRELVRRGLLDATDHDKVNAEPQRDNLAEPAHAAAPKPRPLRAGKHSAPVAPAAAPRAVEAVEAIETIDGRLVIVLFDDEIELIGVHEGFEDRIRSPQDLREMLTAASTGHAAGWPPASEDAQATYDRLTEYRHDYNVIGRWSQDAGLDLTELSFSRLLGRGPRAILGPRLAA